MRHMRFGLIALFALALYGFPGSVFAEGDEPAPTEPENQPRKKAAI